MEENIEIKSNDFIQHVFIIGSKSIGQYGGFETFVHQLIKGLENVEHIKLHVACKANGEGSMDETALSDVIISKKDEKSRITEFYYKNARAYKIFCPRIGPAVAIYYDLKAIKNAVEYCKENGIKKPIFYILACRIGIGIKRIKKEIKRLDGILFLNPDGHEWKRDKWPLPVKWYWKWSEKRMVSCADLVICDSINIEKYIKSEYGVEYTCYISYGAEIRESKLSDEDPKFLDWMKEKGIEKDGYYLIVGRLVPENNYKVMIREFMNGRSRRKLVIISNENAKLKNELEKELGFRKDSRIIFAGTVYDQELLKKLRENAYGYLHGHEVGGTNPSLLEAMGSTKMNLLLDVGFNREVGSDAVQYWTKEVGNLSSLIDELEVISSTRIEEYGIKAKERIRSAYTWEKICNEYIERFTSI